MIASVIMRRWEVGQVLVWAELLSCASAHDYCAKSLILKLWNLDFQYNCCPIGIRKGSGGSGTWYGGDGVEREYEFQEENDFFLFDSKAEIGPGRA